MTFFLLDFLKFGSINERNGLFFACQGLFPLLLTINPGESGVIFPRGWVDGRRVSSPFGIEHTLAPTGAFRTFVFHPPFEARIN
jgi:hypothetical protein